MIKAVFFDLDGTLYDRDATIAGILADQRDAFAADFDAISRDAFVARVIDLDNHGYCRTREVYDAVAREFGLSPSLAERLTSHYWSRFEHHCRPLGDVVATLAELRRRGIRLGIVTNGTATFQQRKVDVLGLRPLLDVVLVSETEKVSKPDREIFERAAARVGAAPPECCFVGDHPAFDVAGAAAAGMMAIWKETPYWSLETTAPAIRTIAEVLTLISFGRGPAAIR